MPVNHHSGSAAPPMGPTNVDQVIFLLEVTWWAHRALTSLITSGALERHPDLQLVFTEQGTAWIPPELARLDYFFDRMGTAVGSQEHVWGAPVVSKLSLKPSEYWARQCHVGASFMRADEAKLRDAVGVNKIMWGSDYPHKEASFPFSREAIRLAFADCTPAEAAAILGGNAAAALRFRPRRAGAARGAGRPVGRGGGPSADRRRGARTRPNVARRSSASPAQSDDIRIQ